MPSVTPETRPMGPVRGSRALRMRLAGAMPARLLVAVVLVGSGGAGLAYSPDPSHVVDAVGRATGFGVRYVKLTGQDETSASAIVASVAVAPDSSIFTVDSAATRRRIEALPWVTRATVRKILPGTLDVEIVEASAAARWRHDGREVLVARDGTVLADDVPVRFRGLPLVAGRGANGAVEDALGLLAAHPQVAARTVAAVYVNERRWDLRLANGATVRLPEIRPGAALERLAALEARGALATGGPVVVDLRLADRTTVELDPPSAAEAGFLGAPGVQEPQEPADLLAAAIAEAEPLMEDPLARAIREATVGETP